MIPILLFHTSLLSKAYQAFHLELSRFWVPLLPEQVLNTSALPDLKNIIGLTDQQPLLLGSKNCPVTDFDMPGQGWRASGSTGGLTNINLFRGSTSTIGQVPAVGNTIVGLASGSGTLAHNVLLLVPDDYGGSPYSSLGARVPKLGNRLTLSQFERYMNFLRASHELSHGAMVLNHIYGLLKAGGYTEIARDSRFPKARVFEAPNPDILQLIYVLPVDTNGLNTSVIRPNLENALTEATTKLGINQVVVNMSFAIVPCDVANDFKANRSLYPTFEHYARRVAMANDELRGTGERFSAFLARVIIALTTPLGPDPLHDLMLDPGIFVGDEGYLIYVAAAGNYGLKYPMYPAAWPEVVGVSSNDFGNTANKSSFSNTAEVMLEGAWFQYKDEERGISTPNLLYAGNSFSSPEVAVFSALDLAHNVPQCGYQAGTFLPKLANKGKVNLTLDKAISLNCSP